MGIVNGFGNLGNLFVDDSLVYSSCTDRVPGLARLSGKSPGGPTTTSQCLLGSPDSPLRPSSDSVGIIALSLFSEILSWVSNLHLTLLTFLVGSYALYPCPGEQEAGT